MSDFIALQRITAPNSYATGYGPGDAVAADVVADWGLVIGEQVDPADDYQPPRPADDNRDRAAWEAYVVGKGTSLEDAREASLAELTDLYEPDPEPEPAAHDLPANAAAEGVDGAGVQNPTPVTAENVPSPIEPDVTTEGTGDGEVTRPAQSARKDEWVDYVVGLGGDADWARADDTTKNDLIAWKPQG